MSGFVSEESAARAVSKASAYLGLEIEEARQILYPWDARSQTEEEKMMRAGIINEIYKQGYSLSEVGHIAGGLSKERVRQILASAGHTTRPMPGSARWRLERARV